MNRDGILLKCLRLQSCFTLLQSSYCRGTAMCLWWGPEFFLILPAYRQYWSPKESAQKSMSCSWELTSLGQRPWTSFTCFPEISQGSRLHLTFAAPMNALSLFLVSFLSIADGLCFALENSLQSCLSCFRGRWLKQSSSHPMPILMGKGHVM